MKLKICFLAPSCYGKSTASEIIIKEFGGSVVKIGKPLYDLQREFYMKLGININDKQDGELLQFYGYKIRKEKPDYLLNKFYEEVKKAEAISDIIINDDCRPRDYEFLKNMGFVFVKINGFKRERDDKEQADSKSNLEWQSEIHSDYEINNFGNLDEYRDELFKLMEVLKSDRQVLHYTSGKSM